MRTAVRISSILLFMMLSLPAIADDMFVYLGAHGTAPHTGFSLAHFDTDRGGCPCLNSVATAGWRSSSENVERLRSTRDLADWLMAAQLVPVRRRLRQMNLHARPGYARLSIVSSR
jgi:hypothetical protein